ncbi:hypothetical protein [Mycobacterium sp. AT1]|uniref:hypothetical protein n=1 Tax=Mycobacterium sp. AT1 TaxID=1961706 RepID=UPI0009AC84EE|nr:hypothetical protein [Mycobacterium sp. AT1]OPX07973.1 hypothetical protein B1790_21015 [Mycobacterium sp. AT1]
MSMLTLQDVADLAKVRRPVVSMWRKRPVVHGVSMPFPEPVAVVAGVAQYSRPDVVDWLSRTGRGNNVDFSYDAAALAAPDGVVLEDVVTLLCWHVLTGEELGGTTLAQRIRLAAEHDSNDTLLLREIKQLQPPPAALVYVDDLVEASYGASDALARVESGRLKRTLAARDLTPEAVELLRAVTTACVGHLDQDGAALRTDGMPLTLEVANGADLYVVGDDRAIRRRAVIKGIPVSETDARRPSVSVWSVVGLDLAAALDRVDEVVVALDQNDVAVVLGPATALCDHLAGAPQQRRAQTLRVGNLVAAIRLPRGMWREAHRQSLSAWICLGGARSQRPWIADLAAADHVELADLAADVAGALAQTDDRAFRYARRTDLAGVIAAGSLVPRGVRAPRLRNADSTTHLERVHGATLTTTTPLQPLDVLVAPSPGRFRMRFRSLGELHEQKHVIIKRGSRINPADATSDGTVAVLPVDVVGALRLDPFDASHRYPRANRTDPGDVVFVEKPRPRAWVDVSGGALVASPAKIIRLRESAEFGPWLLVAVINEMCLAGSEWPTWSVPVMMRDEADRLEAALLDANRYEHEARRRTDAARDLKKALIEGVAAGALTLDAQPTTPGIAGLRE